MGPRIPTDSTDPTTWLFGFTVAWLLVWIVIFYFFPNGLTKKDKERNLTETEYQKWLKSRTGEAWDQKKEE